MTRTFPPRQWAVALVLVLIGTFGSALVEEIFAPSPLAPPPVAQPIPPAPHPEPLSPTNLQQVREGLGPFQTIVVRSDTETPDTDYPAVLMLKEDGSTQASEKWTVPFDTATWTREDHFLIDRKSPMRGYFIIVSSNRTFTVQALQPFVFEAEPEKAVVIDAQGVVWVKVMPLALQSRKPIDK